MTLQIKSTDTIGGIPILRIRKFLGQVLGWHCDSFNRPWIRGVLELDESSVWTLVEQLQAQGYIEPPKDGEYALTYKGRRLVAASAAGKVNRKTAQTALAGLLARAVQYNRDLEKIRTIKAIVVFGSILGPEDTVGDLDVAVKVEDRNLKDPKRSRTSLEYARKSGRQFHRFIDKLLWADEELCRILKARKRTIRLQDWDGFLSLVMKAPHRVPYRVVFGSRQVVTMDIRKHKNSLDEVD